MMDAPTVGQMVHLKVEVMVEWMVDAKALLTVEKRAST